MSEAPLRKPRKGPGGVRRKSVARAQTDWIETAPLLEGKAIPCVVRPAMDGMDLVEWAGNNRDRIDALLMEHRALLFRGFGIDTVDRFNALVNATSDGQLLEYRDRTTPRTTEGDRIYTATVHPPDQTINLHNEGTYWVRWAQRLHFCCLTPPQEGGETPFADVRKVYARLDPAVRDRFVDKKWMLVRNYNDGFGLPWQEVFQTDSRTDVEEHCRANAIEYEWKDGDRLRTRQVRPAVRTHPVTGEKVWFNHAAFYHQATLDSAMRDALVGEFGEDGLPYATYYGDGTPIESDVVEQIRAAYLAEKVKFPWQRGDAALLDNMSVAHAREPYVGDRRVLVAMTDVVEEAGA